MSARQGLNNKPILRFLHYNVSTEPFTISVLQCLKQSINELKSKAEEIVLGGKREGKSRGKRLETNKELGVLQEYR